ncbi:hypothetical protein [Streptomyces sp. NPDC052042]|uniref:hypothetical protein n=1 Tax=Streptomyces sp. NPDC052042 TaxID=3365683 RepID=UPI0037CF453D
MGWTVLYIAFGIVALWLLGEVLLQYKARLRWRLLAFTGFLCVVVGVLLPSVPVIAAGTIAFAVGQSYVTLSFRRGFSTGWALGEGPRESRRRRAGKGRGARRAAPAPKGADADAEQNGQAPAQVQPESPATAVYEPEPLPDDTGQYGVYSDHARAVRDGGHDDQTGMLSQPGYAAYDGGTGPAGYPAPGQDLLTGHDPFATSHDPFATGHGPFPSGQDAPGGRDSFAASYDYGTGGQQQYAAYSDPYVGGGTSGGHPPYDGYGDGYDVFGGRQQYAADPYTQQYAETPAGGVWVPQQREGEQYPAMPPGQPAGPAPYPNGHEDGDGYDGRYR